MKFHTTSDVFIREEDFSLGTLGQFGAGHAPNIIRVGPITLFFPEDGQRLREFAELVRAQADKALALVAEKETKELFPEVSNG